MFVQGKEDITDSVLVPQSITTTTDIASTTTLSDGSAWYSKAHFTLNKGRYMIISGIQMVSAAGAPVQLMTGVIVGGTMNATTKIVSGGTRTGEVNFQSLDRVEFPTTSIISVTSDNTVVYLVGRSPASNARISSAAAVVFKIA